MKCGHPDCTGNHHVLGAKACPTRVAKQAGYQARYRNSSKGLLTAVRDNASRRGNR